MNVTHAWLLHDHRHYETLLRECEEAVRAADWSRATNTLGDLIALLKGHFLAEEQVLFPAYENLVHSPASPAKHLRREHDQMRDLLHRISLTLQQQHAEPLLAEFSCLQHIMDQHHEKEEEIFLPMAGHALLEKREEVMERLKRLDWKGALRTWKI
jgi:iron-sulfur cluster repair protein YtfE (RIC family)